MPNVNARPCRHNVPYLQRKVEIVFVQIRRIVISRLSG
jgi:hypothetical protein